MTLRQLINIDEMLKLTYSQGHKVKGQGQVFKFANKLFDYIPCRNDFILMILTHMIDIKKTMKLTSGQGHKVKCQDQMWNRVKILILTLYNEPIIGSW